MSAPSMPASGGLDHCEPVSHRPLTHDDAVLMASALKAVADPTRLRLISLLTASESGEVCVCHLTEPLRLSQGTVSHHLKVLQEAGLVARDKRGTWAYYRVLPGALESLASLLSDR